MQKNARRLMAVLAASGAALAMSMGPASADSDGLSETTRLAWENWDEGACLAAQGAGQMVSGAWVGAPSSWLDLARGTGILSPATQQAWENWDEGAGKLGQGAGQLVSGAWIGIPYSALDFAHDASGAGAGLDPTTPVEMVTPSGERRTVQLGDLGYTCGE